MLHEDDLKRLQAANDILNQKYSELGLKPLGFPSEINGLDLSEELDLDLSKLIESKIEEEKKEEKVNIKFKHLNILSEDEAREIEHLLLDEPVSDLDEDFDEDFDEAQIKPSPKESFTEGPFVLFKKFFIPLALLLIFVLTISSELRANFFVNKKSQEDVSYAKTGEIKNPVRVIKVNTTPFILSSGSYATKEEAKAAKSELAKIAGTALKIKLVNNFYTVQIGPDYKEFDDAVLVYKELSNYPIKDLAIRTEK